MSGFLSHSIWLDNLQIYGSNLKRNKMCPKGLMSLSINWWNSRCKDECLILMVLRQQFQHWPAVDLLNKNLIVHNTDRKYNIHTI